jgi:predicted signal transduction protein with EAL and GGDEF domain
MQIEDPRTKLFIERSGLILLLVGGVSSLCVYLGHDWFHNQFLGMIGLGNAAGDMIGSFFIILFAYCGQRLVSLAIFHDVEFGMMQIAQELQTINEEMQAELDELDQIAHVDQLTGAFNRRRLEELVGGEIERLSRYDHALSMLIIDIDHFKTVNDTFGHPAGDQVLVELTERLQ